MRNLTFIALFVLLMSHVITVFAEELTIDQLLAMPLKDLLDIKITSSTLQEEDIRSVPSAITVITRDEIRRLGATKLEEIVKLVPGFQTARLGVSGTHNTLVSRGRRLGSAGKEVLVLLDGRRLQEDFAGGIQFLNRQVSLDNAQRVEFIRGPGSTIYGTNAFLGVVNIVTGEYSVARAALGSNSMYDTSIQYARFFEGGDISVFAKSNVDDGESLDTYDNKTGLFTDNSDPFDNYELYLKGSLYDFSGVIRFQGRESNRFYSSNLVGINANHWDTNLFYIDVEYDTSLSKRFDVSASVFYTKSTTENDANITFSPFLGHENKRVLAEGGGYLRLKYEDNNGRNGLFGYEYRRPDIVKARNQHVGTSNVELITQVEKPRTIEGVFAQFQDDIFDNLRYILGARLDDFSDVGSHFSPRAGLVYSYDDLHTIKLLYGEAFRAPSRFEVDVSNNPTFEGAENLSPEVSKTWDLVWLYMTNTSLFSTTVFSVTIDDNIVSAPDPNISGKLTRINSGTEHISGLEIEWKNEWLPSVSSRFSATYLFDDAEELTAESRTLLAASVSYIKTDYVVTLTSDFQGAKYDANNSTKGYSRLGGRTVHSGKVSYLAVPQTDIYLKVDNITDKFYYSPTQRAANTFGIPNRGRTFEVGVNYSF